MPFTYNRNAIAADLKRRGSPMTVADFEVAARYGVNPAYAAAIALKESEGGKTGYANKGTFNPYGWGVHSGFKYPSWSAATAALAKGLSGNLYKGSGLRDIGSITQRYAPSSDGNDPAGYTATVQALMKQFGANPNQLFGDQDPNAPGPSGATKNPVGAPTAAAAEPKPPDLKSMAMQAWAQKAPGQSWTNAFGKTYLASKLAEGVAETVGKKSVQAKEGELGPSTPVDGSKFSIALAAGKPHVGKTPYSWGGGSPSGPGRGFGRGAPYVGFDCSSFTQYMAAKAGVKIPRTTYYQIKAGTAVNAGNRSSWQPGDLIFPHTGHVQMYIGDGKVIEAPRTGLKIQISNVRSGTPAAVRRIF